MPHPLGHIPKIEARAAFVSLFVAIALLVLKFIAYYLTNSAAIFSDALESIANVAGAGFALYAIYTAHRPADKNHPYGHGKIEFLSAGFEGSMILTAALVAVLRAVDGFLHKADLHDDGLGLGLVLLGIALLMNGAVGFALLRVGKRANSVALEADGHHLLSDAVTSVVAIAAIGLVRLAGWRYADPCGALLVATYIGVIGLRLMSGAFGGLMDRQDEHDEALIESILNRHVGPDSESSPHICSFHKVRHRHSGRFHWVDFHLVVPAIWNVRQGHETATQIELEIEAALKIGNATAHIEPCTTKDCMLCASGALPKASDV